MFHCWKKSTCIVFNNLEDLLEEGVAVDELLLVLILQLVRLDVLPERRYDDRPAEDCVGSIPGTLFCFLNFKQKERRDKQSMYNITMSSYLV